MHDDRVFPFEKVARLESPERRQRQPPERIVELVASFSPSRVLDVGVGTGYFAVPIAVRLPDAQVVGIDQEPRMLGVFRQRAEEASVAGRIETVSVPRDSTSQPDASVDLVLMANIHHELPSRVEYLKDVHRALRPGGVAILCDWDPRGPSDAGPPADHRIDEETVAAELAAAGFDNVRSHALYEHFYVVEAHRTE